MKYALIFILALTLTACQIPGDMTDGKKKDFTVGGTCDIEEASWAIEHDASKGKTTFSLTILGGECEMDE